MSSNETDFRIRNEGSPLPGPRKQERARIGKQFLNERIAADIYCVIEVLVVFATGIVAAHIHQFMMLGEVDYLRRYLYPLLILPLVFGIGLFRARLYNIQALTQFARYYGHVFGVLLISFCGLIILGSVLGVTDNYSRIWFGSWLVGAVFTVWLLRAFAARQFNYWIDSGAIQRAIAVYGYGEPLKALLSDTSLTNRERQLVGVYGPEPDAMTVQRQLHQGDLEQLIEATKNRDTDCIILAVPLDGDPRVSEVAKRLSALAVEIKIFPHKMLDGLALVGTSRLDNQNFIDIQSRTLSERGALAKLVEDYVIASILAVVLSPLLLLIAIAIKLESHGPALFRQERNGINDTVFEILKFRTMYVYEPQKGFAQAQRNDPRVTKVGRLLRRMSLDELPQIFNVLRGEMSIVGPRPHEVRHNELHKEVLPHYLARQRVKPGITGWAQVNDLRGPTVSLDDMAQRLKYDLYYIENWSVLFDLSIIAATPLISIIHRNAV